jgi:hypothetical protein
VSCDDGEADSPGNAQPGDRRRQGDDFALSRGAGCVLPFIDKSRRTLCAGMCRCYAPDVSAAFFTDRSQKIGGSTLHIHDKLRKHAFSSRSTDG